jgi:hypothetical protein
MKDNLFQLLNKSFSDFFPKSKPYAKEGALLLPHD